MTTIEDRLRDMGRTVTPPPLPGATAVMDRARQRRRRRRGGLAAVAIAAGTGAGLTGRSFFAGDDGPTVRTAPAASTDDGSGGDSPGGWEEVPSTGGSGDPGAWEEVPSAPADGGGVPEAPGGPADPGDPGAWDQVPSDPPGGTGQWDEAPAPPASGTDTVAVPDVVGLLLEQGRSVLQDLGFAVEVLVDDGAGDDLRIVGQDVEPGSVVPTGSVIRLHLG
jgi:hypothetical protein